MTDIHIPPAALEAGREAVANARLFGRLPEEIARAAFLAMIAAWEGSWNEQENGSKVLFDKTPNLILPLPTQENGDDR